MQPRPVGHHTAAGRPGLHGSRDRPGYASEQSRLHARDTAAYPRGRPPTTAPPAARTGRRDGPQQASDAWTGGPPTPVAPSREAEPAAPPWRVRRRQRARSRGRRGGGSAPQASPVGTTARPVPRGPSAEDRDADARRAARCRRGPHQGSPRRSVGGRGGGRRRARPPAHAARSAEENPVRPGVRRASRGAARRDASGSPVQAGLGPRRASAAAPKVSSRGRRRGVPGASARWP